MIIPSSSRTGIDSVGPAEGLEEGAILGSADGLEEGFTLGSADGLADGIDEGADDGVDVGAAEGVEEGSEVGIAVGEGVGVRQTSTWALRYGFVPSPIGKTWNPGSRLQLGA